MSAERYQRISKILNLRQPDLTVFMDDVHKPYNLGAIVRTCDAVGVNEVNAWSSRPRLTTPNLASGGSRPWVKLKRYRSPEEGIQSLKERGFKLVAANLSANAKPYTDYDFTQPTAIVVGTEKRGVSDLMLEHCDTELIIPMVGMVESLNVSVATALMLFEAKRQRELAGLYEQRRIPDEEFERRLFERCQPRLAGHCRRYGLPYPEMDEEGCIVGALDQRYTSPTK